MAEKFPLDKNYNLPMLIALGIVVVSLIHSIVKYEKQKKQGQTQTPISQAIADIKNGNTQISQVPKIQ